MLAARPACSNSSRNRVGPSTGPESRYAFRVQNYHRIDGVEVERTIVRRSPTQVLGLDQHSPAMAHFEEAAEFCVEVTEADEAARRALCFLAADEELPSVKAERAFLVYGRDDRDVRVCVEIKILRRGRAVVLHAIDATPARWRGYVGSSPLDGASAATSSPRNDLVKNYRVHPTHWLISTQVTTAMRAAMAAPPNWTPITWMTIVSTCVEINQCVGCTR